VRFLPPEPGVLSVQLEQASQARCARLAFELDPEADFAAIRRQLSEEGIRCQEHHGVSPAIPRMLSFTDPNGTVIELFSEWKYLGPWRDGVGVGPLKLGHVAFFATDFFVFMRCNPDHHSVNFVRGEKVRMHHIAFELKDIAHIGNPCDILAQHKIPLVWGPLRFGPGHNIAAFHRDQDGQLVEFYAELDQLKDEHLGYFDPRPWHREMPQRPKIWSRQDDPIWGPPPPADFM
jgi:catechol 2,3-dioxygenase-like lactoylglutathione lyase family enzyme